MMDFPSEEIDIFARLHRLRTVSSETTHISIYLKDLRSWSVLIEGTNCKALEYFVLVINTAATSFNLKDTNEEAMAIVGED